MRMIATIEPCENGMFMAAYSLEPLESVTVNSIPAEGPRFSSEMEAQNWLQTEAKRLGVDQLFLEQDH